MIRSLALCCFLALLALGCAADGDLIEPDLAGTGLGPKADGFSGLTTTRLEFGGEASAEFDSDFQFFAFEFDTLEDAVVRAEVTQRGSSRGLDTTMFLYRISEDSEPTRIGSDDDSGYGALSRIDDFRIYRDGHYAFVVGTRSAAGRGRFRVTLDCVEGVCVAPPPPVSVCPTEAREAMLGCMESLSIDASHELAPVALAVGCTGDGQVADEVTARCDAADSPAWCARPISDVVARCEAEARDAYPSPDDLLARVTPIDDVALGAIEDAAHASEGCGNSAESGCEVHVAAYRYRGETPRTEEALQLARALSPIGRGTTLQQWTHSGLSWIFDELETVEQVESFLAAQNADVSNGLFAGMSGSEVEWNRANCQGEGAAAVFEDASLVLVVSATWCTD